MGKVLIILLLSALLFAVATAAPKEESEETTAVETKDTKTKTKGATEREIDVTNEDSTISTWLANNYVQYGLSGLAILLILGGLGYATYHFYFSPMATAVYVDNQVQPNSYPGYTTTTYPYNTFATGRSLESPWNFTKVLEYIDIAQKTYEGFDWQDLNCQKRTLCELAQKQSEPWGETGRKLTNSYAFRFLDALDGFPIPRVIQTYLNEYREAISQGKNSPKDCGQVFSGCKFSIKDVLSKAASKTKTA